MKESKSKRIGTAPRDNISERREERERETDKSDTTSGWSLISVCCPCIGSVIATQPRTDKGAMEASP